MTAAAVYWYDALVLVAVIVPLWVFGWWVRTLLKAPRPRLTCVVCESNVGTVSEPRFGYPASHAVCRSRLRHELRLDDGVLYRP